MAYKNDYRTFAGTATASAAAVDAGLRAYMLRVYNWMASGLLLTGIVSYMIANTALVDLFYPLVSTEQGMQRDTTLLGLAAMFAPLAFVLVLSMGVNRLSALAAQGLYWAFCAAMGASMAVVFLAYTQASVASAFFVTAGTFAAMSIWGYTTRSDLTRMGNFMIMGLFGIIIAGLVNVFLGSPAIQFATSVLGVVVFVGLTAYDTQRIKCDYVEAISVSGPGAAAKRSVYDSLSLMLNFLNLFLLILRLTGTRSSD